MRNFIKKYAYGNAETAQLYAELDAVNNVVQKSFENDLAFEISQTTASASELMKSWTGQTGFPLIHVDTHGATNE